MGFRLRREGGSRILSYLRIRLSRMVLVGFWWVTWWVKKVWVCSLVNLCHVFQEEERRRFEGILLESLIKRYLIWRWIHENEYIYWMMYSVKLSSSLLHLQIGREEVNLLQPVDDIDIPSKARGHHRRCTQHRLGPIHTHGWYSNWKENNQQGKRKRQGRRCVRWFIGFHQPFSSNGSTRKQGLRDVD